MKTNTMRKLFAVLLAGLLLPLLVGGCGDEDFPSAPDTSQAESTPEPMPILTVWIDNPNLWIQNLNTDKLWETVEGNQREFMLQTEI